MKTLRNKIILSIVLLALLVGAAYQLNTVRKQKLVIAEQYNIISELSRKSEGISMKLESLAQNGGFMEFPFPKEGEKEYLLIIQSFGGGSVYPAAEDKQNLNQMATKYYVAYDMRRNKFVALQDSSMGFAGKDFVIVISNGPNGTRTWEPKKGEEATALFEQFGLMAGPTRY